MPIKRDATSKFGWLTRDILDAAATEILSEPKIPPRRKSVYFDVIVNGKPLPPKYVIERAARISGRHLGPENFVGGDGEANRVLRKFGFEVRDRRSAPRAFLQYWKPQEVQAELERERKRHLPLRVIGGTQLKKLRAGDVVWICSIREPGQLVLCGRLIVEGILNRDDAPKRLGYDPEFSAKWYAYTQEEQAEELRVVDVAALAKELAFIPERKLTLRNGKVNPQQLQSMRRLSSHDTNIIREAWFRSMSGGDHEFDQDSTDDLDEEGAKIYRTQQLLERSRHNRLRVLASKGYACEVCKYEFATQFAGFPPSAQVHHKSPLGAGKRKASSLTDFAVLCAPCHMAAHMGEGRKLNPWSIEELRAKIRKTWIA